MRAGLRFLLVVLLALILSTQVQTPAQDGHVAAMPRLTLTPSGPARDDYGHLLPAGAVKRLGFPHAGQGQPPRPAVSPDGKQLATLHDETILLWDLDAGKILYHWLCRAQALVFSADGRSVMALNSDYDVQVWSVETGEALRRFEVSLRFSWSCAFSPDGRFLAISTPFGPGPQQSDTACVEVWDTAAGRLIRRLEARASQFVFSADSERLVTNEEEAADGGGWRRFLRTWEVETGRELGRIDTPLAVFGLAASPDDQHLAVVICTQRPSTTQPHTSTYHLELWDWITGKVVRTYPESPANCPVWPPVISRDGKYLAAAESVERIQLWDLTTGQNRGPLLEEQSHPALAFLPDGTLAAAGTSGSVTLWDAASGKARHLTGGHRYAVDAIAYSPDGQTLASAGGNQVLLWDAGSGREVGRFWMKGGADALAFSADGQLLLLRNKESWRIEVRQRTGQRIDWPDWALIQPIAFSADGRTLALGRPAPRSWHGVHPRPDPQVEWVWLKSLWHAWQVGRQEELRRFRLVGVGQPLVNEVDNEIFQFNESMHSSTHLVALSSSGSLGVESISVFVNRPFTGSGGYHKSGGLRLIDTATGRERRRIGREKGASWHPLLSPNEKLMAVVADHTILLLELATGQTRHTLAASDAILEMAFSPDSRLLALSTDRQSIELWDTITGQRLAELPERGVGRALAFAPNGKRLAAGMRDGTILIWNTAVVEQNGPLPLTAEERARLWLELAGDDAARASRAVGRLLAAPPDQAITLLRDRLQLPELRRQVEKLIGNLENDRFHVRQAAREELESMANLAEPALRRQLKNQPTLEQRHRLEQVLARAGQGPSAREALRVQRAIEIVEHIGTAEARQLLQTLAGDQPGNSPLTRMAQDALQRLNRSR